MERFRSRLGDPERGASAIIVGVAILGLVGMAAFVIDIGALFEERRDLQNGADAAALAVAADCAQNGICTAAAAQPEAERIAAFNSNDGQATVNQSDIVFDVANAKVTVTVHTKDASDGDGEIDYVLAPVLGKDSKAVSATASAGWASPGGGVSLPLTISACEWEEATGGGNPPDPLAFPAYAKIWLHDGAGSPDPTPCPPFGPGMDVDGDGDIAEGGFGFLDATDCKAELVGPLLDYMIGKPGAGNPGSLGCDLTDVLGRDLLIPIFDDIAQTGNPCGAPPGQNCYHVYGFGAFRIDNIDLNGTWSNQGDICVAADRCLDGHFIQFVSLAEAPGWGGGPAPNLGAHAVTLTG